MTAIFKRELKSYFTTPIGYIVLAVYYALMGLLFHSTYSSGSPDITGIISTTNLVGIVLIPILTMRLICDDRRQKVDQAIFTAPVKLVSVVLGKFLAAFSVFALCFFPTVIFEIIFASKVKMNAMTYIYALLGVLLLGAALISIGMFISCLTESSAISAILSIVVNAVFIVFMPVFSSAVKNNKFFSWLSVVFDKLSFMNAYESFNTSIFKVANILYFLSIVAVFLFLCVRSLEKRRWA
ncbi:MAG: ABC transporter permease [Clostridia bacterium]|nr:ABC transporter permease [Clostridia bacterium]